MNQDRAESWFERVCGFRPRRADAVAAGLLLAALAIFFGPVLFSKVFFFRDIATEIVPKRTWLTRAGLQVLWNPLMFFGLPEGANPQSATFYPLNLIFYLAPVPRALSFYVAVHFAVAAGFTYLLARALGQRAEASLTAALALGFGGPLVSCANQIVVLNSAAWIMPLMWGLLRGLATGRKSFVIAAGAFWALMVLGGEPEIAYLAGIAAAIFLAGAVLGDQGPSGWAGWQRAGLVLLGALVGAVSLSCVQWLYTLELTGLSNRAGGVSWEASLKWSLEPRMLWSLLSPNYFMDAGGAKYWVLGLRNDQLPYLLSVYPGLVAVVLLSGGLAALGSRRGGNRPGRMAAVFGAGGIVFLLLSLGRWGGLYWLFYHFLPGFDRFRIPERCMVGFSVFFALVLGQAMEALALGAERAGAWLAPETRLRRWLTALVLAGLAAAGYLLLQSQHLPADPATEEDYLPYHHLLLGLALMRSLAMTALILALAAAAMLRTRIIRPAFWAAAAVVFLDLFLAHRHAAPTAGADFFDLTGNMISKLPRREDGMRVVVAQPETAEYWTVGVKKELAASFKKDRLDLQAFTGLELGVREVGARSSFYPGDVDLWVSMLPPLQMRLLAQGGVRFMLKPGYQAAPVPDSLPRAFVVPAADWRSNRDEALARISDPSFDPRRSVVLEGPARRPPESRGTIFWPMTISADENQHVAVEVERDHPGYLVLLDSFYPGWTARVNGRPAELFRANGFFRAVEVGPEGGLAEFDYRPTRFYLGLAISLIAAGVGAAVWWRERVAARIIAGAGASTPPGVIAGWAGLVIVLAVLPMVDGGTDYRAAALQRITVLAMAAAWTWGLGKQARFQRTRIDGWVLAFWVLTAVSLVRSQYFYISFYWALYILTLILLFYFVVQFTAEADGAARARGIMLLLAAAGAFESGWAVVQTGRALHGGAGRLQPWFQAAGGYLNPSLLAGGLLAVSPYCLGRALESLRPGCPRSWGRNAAWAALTAVLLLGMAATGSRALIIAPVPLGLVALPGLAQALAARGMSRGRAWAWSAGVPAGLAALGMAVVLLTPNPIHTRLDNLQSDVYANERPKIWRTGLAVAADHPLGVGLGLFKYAANQHRFPIDRVIGGRYEKHAESAHNEYIHLAAEMSVLGPLLLLAPFGWLCLRCLKAQRAGGFNPALTGLGAGLAAVAMHALVEANLHCMAIGALAVTLAAVLMTELSRAGGDELIEITPSRPGAWALMGVMGLAAAAGIAASAYLAYGQGLTLAGETEKDPARAALLLSNSSRYASGNATHYKSLAGSCYALFKQNQDAKTLERAFQAVDEAIRLNPADPDLYRMRGEYGLSLYLMTRKDQFLTAREGAEPSLAAALAMSPFDVDAAIGRAWSAELRGDREAEVRWWRYALALEPYDLMSRLRLVQVLMEMGRRDEAATEWMELDRRRAEVKALLERNPNAYASAYRAKRVWIDEAELAAVGELVRSGLEKPPQDD